MRRFVLVLALAVGPSVTHASPLALQEPGAATGSGATTEASPAPDASASVESLLSRALGIRPTVLGEIDYRVYPSSEEGNTGFALPRFRPGVILAPTDWFRAVTTVEFAGEYPIILDAFMSLRATPWVEFSLGYAKPPIFPSFIYEPDASLPFPDRSPVITSFQIRRDLGADVHFTPRNIPLDGWLRIGNGTGSALGNDNALPAGYASLDLVLGRAWVGTPAEHRTFGLRLGASAFIESAGDREGITGETPLGFLYYRPIVVSGLRGVVAGHAIAYAGPLRFSVEGATARESRSRDDDGNPATPRIELPTVRSHGVTAEVAWVLRGRPREVGVPPRGLLHQDGTWGGGAVEIAARYDGLWLGRGASDVRAGGSQGGALAVKWWPTDFLATALAGYLTRYDFAPVEEPDQLWSWGVIARASFFWGNPAR